MNFYLVTLFAHSYLRWVVLGAAVWTVAVTALGLVQKREWSPLHAGSHAVLLRAADLQFTLGLILYLFLSPFSQTFFANLGGAMKDPILRFFGIEHVFGMLLAVSCVHIGHLRGKKAQTGRQKLRRVFTWSLVALLWFVVSVPWPFLRYGRPLLRGIVP